MNDNEYRCLACGAFLTHVDTSTESGYNFELVCNNPRCKSNRKPAQLTAALVSMIKEGA